MSSNIKKKRSQRCITLPNKKTIQLHNQYNFTPQNKVQTQQKQKCVPQFWGCIMPRHLQQIQKQRLEKPERSKTQQKQSLSKLKLWQTYQIKELIGGENLLTKYLKRKKKFTQKQFQRAERAMLQKKRLQKFSKANPQTSIFQINEKDDPLQKYFYGINLVERTPNESSQRIKSLNQIMKWNNKIAANILSGNHHRKSIKKNQF